MLCNGFAYDTAATWDGTRWLESFCGAKVGSVACDSAGEGAVATYFSVLVFCFYKCRDFNFG